MPQVVKFCRCLLYVQLFSTVITLVVTVAALISRDKCEFDSVTGCQPVGHIYTVLAKGMYFFSGSSHSHSQYPTHFCVVSAIFDSVAWELHLKSRAYYETGFQKLLSCNVFHLQSLWNTFLHHKSGFRVSIPTILIERWHSEMQQYRIFQIFCYTEM